MVDCTLHWHMAATEMHADDSTNFVLQSTQLKIYQWAPIRIRESHDRKILAISGLGQDVSRDFNTLTNMAKNSMSPNSLRQLFFLNISIQNYFQLYGNLHKIRHFSYDRDFYVLCFLYRWFRNTQKSLSQAKCLNLWTRP